MVVNKAIGQEPVHGAAFPTEFLGLPGIEQLRLYLNNKIRNPPISYLTGMRPTEAGAGNATFIMPITPWLLTPQGLWTTGAIAILADGPLGCAVQTLLPPATGYTTTDLSINMVRPVPRTGQLIARGRVVHGGKRLALSEASITDDAGRLIAHGTSRCVIFPPVPNIPPLPAEVPTLATEDEKWISPYLRPIQGDVLDQEVWRNRSGLDVLQAQIAGDLPWPPISYLLGLGPTEASEGSSTFSMPTSPWLTSPSGLVLGGVTACLADIALGGAVETTVPAGTALAPTDLRVQFIRPVPAAGDSIIARAAVVHRGRGMAASRAEVTNEQGKLLALASASAIILPGRRADLDDAASTLG
jgi:uncharacterized protein (TIGR00369 family)